MGTWGEWGACTMKDEKTSCGRGEMTRERSGEVKGCDPKHEKECTDEDKCLGKHQNMFALVTRKLREYYTLST